MSQGNVDLVLKVFRRFEARDFSDARELWHPKALITAPEGWPEQGPFVGIDAVLEQFERLGADFDQQRIEIKNATPRDDWVIAEFEWTARGASSGVETQLEMAGAFKVQDGQITEGHYRWNLADAIEAAGLSG